jgi:S-adenosylmethionine hydrolase
LLLLTNNQVLIIDNFGNLITVLEHTNEAPLKLISEKDKILIIDEKGIDILDLKSGSRINFLKNKFDGVVEYIHFNSNSYIRDSKELYKLSE